jgi:putative component of membrane protein insertase Oxa1/YidC/SpoIIIJ protein YidD
VRRAARLACLWLLASDGASAAGLDTLPDCRQLAIALREDVAPEAAKRGSAGTWAWTARLWLGLWSATLTRVDGDRCQLRPSCSVYARHAIQARGPLLGAVHATARLMRDHGTGGRQLCVVGGRIYAWDPLSAHLAER